MVIPPRKSVCMLIFYRSACAASALRLYYSQNRLRVTDITRWYTPVGIYAAAEITAVLLCGCLPIFPRFYKYIKEKRRQEWEYELSGSARASPSQSRLKASQTTMTDGAATKEGV